MKREILMGVVFGFFFATAGFSVPITETQVWFDVGDLGSGRWQYSYEVTHISLPKPIEEFTIWFDFGLYENLSIQTPDPPAGDWDEIVVQPEPVLADDGFYDALTLDTGVGIGQTVSGFAVSFNWLGIGQPGPQFYEIIDPTTFETLNFGWTVPEPATLLLLGFGGFLLRKPATKRHKK